MLNVLKVVEIEGKSHVDLDRGIYRPCTVVASEYGWTVVDIEDTSGLPISAAETGLRFRINRFYFKDGEKGWWLMNGDLWFKILDSDCFVYALDKSRIVINGNILAENSEELKAQLETHEGRLAFAKKNQEFCPQFYKSLLKK